MKFLEVVFRALIFAVLGYVLYTGTQAAYLMATVLHDMQQAKPVLTDYH